MSWWNCRVFDRWIEVLGPYDVNGVVTAMSARQQEGWAHANCGRLPTAEEFDWIWLGADVRVEPETNDPVKAPLTFLNESIVLAKRFPEQTVAAGKTWIQHPRQIEKGAVNYGFFVPQSEVRIVGNVPKWRGMNVVKSVTGRLHVIQSPGGTHGPNYSDYSQLGYAVRDLDHTPITRPDTTSPPEITEPGESGPKVRAWQHYLNITGFGPIKEDGIHGTKETEPATERYLTAMSLKREGDKVVTLIPPTPLPHDTEPHTPVLSMELPPIKFKRDPNYKTGRPSGPPIWVVIHTAECKESPAAAEALQGWDSLNVSWHYAVDNDSITQSVLEDDRSQTVGRNPAQERGIHIELAGYARQTAIDWADAYSLAELDLAALLVAHICHRWSILTDKVGPTMLRANVSGICGHSDVTKAWPGTTTHVNPGVNFPWVRFIELVKMNLSLID